MYMAMVRVLSVMLVGLAAAKAEPVPVSVPFDMAQDAQGSLVDLRFLNHRPAGRLGRVRAQGDSLVWGDGQEARFWGVNLQAYALFATQDSEIEDHARRLARIGVNLARIHHHDSHWVVPNVFGGREASQTMLDDAAMERLDRWIAALKAEGIYIWLDLHVGRRVGVDAPIAHADELQGDPLPGDLRGFNFVNPDIKHEMQRVNAAYLTHVNRYTGLAYKDDPAIAFLLISNENDLVTHFGAQLAVPERAPSHHALYMALAQDFARANGLWLRDVWKAWDSGTPKRFLADLEARFFADMITHIRGLGYDGLLATSSFWGGMSLAGLPSLSLGDFMDAHSYGAPGELAQDPRDQFDMFSPIAAAHLVGKPLTISEWNLSPFPASNRGVAVMRMAAMAGFQGWDAPILYGYAQNGLSAPVVPNNWHAANDPVVIGAFPAAALLFRARQIQPAELRYIYRPTSEALFDKTAIGPAQQNLRAYLGQTGVQVALPEDTGLAWLRGVAAPQDSLPDARPSGDGALASESGEIRHLFGPGMPAQLLLDSPQAQVAAGDLSGSAVILSGARFDIAARDALVALQSLGGSPIVQAERLLLSLVGPAALQKGAESGFQTAPLSGEIRFDAPFDIELVGTSPNLTQSQLTHHKNGTAHVLILRDIVPPVWVTLTRGQGD